MVSVAKSFDAPIKVSCLERSFEHFIVMESAFGILLQSLLLFVLCSFCSPQQIQLDHFPCWVWVTLLFQVMLSKLRYLCYLFNPNDDFPSSCLLLEMLPSLLQEICDAILLLMLITVPDLSNRNIDVQSGASTTQHCNFCQLCFQHQNNLLLSWARFSLPTDFACFRPSQYFHC